MSDTSMQYDLVIVGGGINGAALARLCAFNGKKVLLVEKNDFANGASSASSKMIHGGLRYLEQMDFGLVREAVRERKVMLDTCPHLVDEEKFLFPLVKENRYPGWFSKVGVYLYHFLSGNQKLKFHKSLNKKQFLAEEKHFRRDNVKGSHAYADCMMDDSRLVFENLIHAQELGAKCLNYHQVIDVCDDESTKKVRIQNILDHEDFEVQAHKVILTCGPWNDLVKKELFQNEEESLILSQGAHIIVDLLPIKHNMILPVPGSARYFFVLNYFGKHLIGTTETEVDKNKGGSVKPLEEEVEELKALFKLYFPELELDMTCAFAGVRPLAKNENAKDSISVSRKHVISEIGDNLYSGVGGKYTTHRIFAEDAWSKIYPDESFKDLKEEKFPGAVSKHGFDEVCRTYEFLNKMDEYSKRCLWQTYGANSKKILDRVTNPQMSSAELQNALIQAEILYTIEEEWVKKPEDFLRRRTRFFFDGDAGQTLLKSLADLLQLDEEIQIQEYKNFLRECRHVAVDDRT